MVAIAVVLSAAMNLTAASPDPEPTRTGAIAGRILDEHGTGIGFSLAIVLGKNLGAYANGSGKFRLNAPPGTYTLRGAALGHAPREIVVRVVADSTIDVEFRLPSLVTRYPQGEPLRNRWPYVSYAGAQPCPQPMTISTKNWKRSRFFTEPVSFRFPRSFSRDSTALYEHGGIRWIDGDRSLEQVNGLWGETSFGNPNTTPGYSECVDTISGVPYRIITGYWSSYPAYSAVAIPMNDGPAYREILTGMSPDSSDLSLFRTIFATLRTDSMP
jgi:hypothetical protein